MTSKSELTTISKFLSLVLRHEPQQIGIELDEAGWTSVNVLLQKAAAAGRPLSVEVLQEVVAGSDKQRFAFSADGLRIRANQGHSVEVDLGLPVMTPPDVLYHGTARRFLESIMREGLLRGERHHVHLTEIRETAVAVGARYGEPVLLRVDAKGMVEQGVEFRRSANGVWLVASAPSAFLRQEV